MTDEGVVVQPIAKVSRRTIVRTGVRLAYAAPVVAASFNLTPLRAMAAEDEAISGESKPEPPKITKVQSKEPNTVDITGQRLAGATVRVTIDDGSKEGKVVTRSWLDGTIVLNTDRRIRIKIKGGTVIIQLVVATPNGEVKYKKKKFRVKSEEKPAEEQQSEPEQTPTPENADQNQEQDDQTSEEPRDTTEDQPPAEEQPADEEPAPTEEPPVEEQPVEEVPVEEPPPTEEPTPTEEPVRVDPKVRLSKPTGDRGDDVQVNGTGFLPGDITILWDDERLATTAASDDGSFEVIVTVPDTADAGSHEITAQDVAGNTSSKKFRVLA